MFNITFEVSGLEVQTSPPPPPPPGPKDVEFPPRPPCTSIDKLPSILFVFKRTLPPAPPPPAPSLGEGTELFANAFIPPPMAEIALQLRITIPPPFVPGVAVASF